MFKNIFVNILEITKCLKMYFKHFWDSKMFKNVFVNIFGTPKCLRMYL
jgi:hypothetical protein